MTMLNSMRRSEPKLPKANNVPAPRAPAPQPAVTPMYDEEVLRVAQRDFDQKRLIQQLEAERDEWRRKALSAEAECRRLEARIEQDTKAHDDAVARLTEDRDRRIDELTARRDEYKLKLARFETRIGVQGRAVIDLANSISKTILETMDDLQGEKGAPDIAGSVGLAAIADAIEDPLPRVVTAGPQEGSRDEN